MNSTTPEHILAQKEPANLYDVMQPALRDVKLRDFLVDGSFAKDETLRYNCVRVLMRAMVKQPDLFYPYWDRFEKGIDSVNGFHRSVAAQAIAHLSSVDVDCRLDRVLNHYLGLLDDSKVMVAHYFIETLGLIYRARPDFRQKIFATLLDIENTHHTPERRELIKADVLIVLDQLFDDLSASNQNKASGFVKAQLGSKSPKARKAAKEFLKKHGV